MCQEDRHQHDGPELTDGSDGEQVGPERRGEHPRVADDGEQGAQRRGGEGQTHDEGVECQSGRHQGEGHTERQNQRQQPTDRSQSERLPLDPVELQVEAG